MDKPASLRGGRRRRCAIYTRKSSEEGLEQEFNSLHAQREACEAFVQSQRHEGWTCLAQAYNDGGLSGATIDRPALQQLLADIQEGRVDIVVCYKVDRLTRSLADFAKIVEIFDAKGVSFVSVTQQFNTTTSMGRLTLNVLLSFAQFEREVTGERIRDKIAASKKKGMWMGGVPPLGYQCRDHKLIVIPSEAETVQHIFRRYAALGSVRLLQQALDAAGIRSKTWISTAGRRWGGKPLARGALYLMLRNRIYRGEIVHKDQHYPGKHEPIIDEPLWEEVQAKLAANAVERATGERVLSPSLLAGLLYDGQGHRMTPSHAVKKGMRYRYYVSQPLINKAREAAPQGLRIAAAEIERIVLSAIGELISDPGGSPRRSALMSRPPASSNKSWCEPARSRRPGRNSRPHSCAPLSRCCPGASPCAASASTSRSREEDSARSFGASRPRRERRRNLTSRCCCRFRRGYAESAKASGSSSMRPSGRGCRASRIPS
jgi:site-specific DNA recombinase